MLLAATRERWLVATSEDKGSPPRQPISSVAVEYSVSGGSEVTAVAARKNTLKLDIQRGACCDRHNASAVAATVNFEFIFNF